jgi:hypothetical protein
MMSLLTVSRDETGAAAIYSTVRRVSKSSLSPVGACGGRSIIARRSAQYCGRCNITGAQLRDHHGDITAARRRGETEIMIRNAAISFPEVWVTEHGAPAKLKIAHEIHT